MSDYSKKMFQVPMDTIGQVLMQDINEINIGKCLISNSLAVKAMSSL